jgi:hypothetical protein
MARVVGYNPFSLYVIHKEGLRLISKDINRLMMMMLMTILFINNKINYKTLLHFSSITF